MRIMNEWLPFLHKDIEITTVDGRVWKGLFLDIEDSQEYEDFEDFKDLDSQLLSLEMPHKVYVIFKPDDIKEIKEV